MFINELCYVNDNIIWNNKENEHIEKIEITKWSHFKSSFYITGDFFKFFQMS